jgi:hypothetical protein
MVPTTEQMQVAAYHLWERRGRIHGHDRDDWDAALRQLTFNLNYTDVQKFSLSEPAIRVLGQQAIRRCRFCERTSKHARFGDPSAVVPIVPRSSLLTAEVCAECKAECLDPVAPELDRCWEALRSVTHAHDDHAELPRNTGFSLGANKALAASALLILPDRELAYFSDALEWISNPDQDVDERLFAGAWCRVYRESRDLASPWAGVARRIDDDAPLPYIIAFLSCRGMIVQFHLPLCSRDDDDNGGGSLPLLERPFDWHETQSFDHVGSRLVPVLPSSSLARSQGRHRLVEC